MKKSFKSIKKSIGLGVFLVALLFIASYVSSVVPHTYAFIAPSLPGGGASEPGGGSIPLPTVTITANVTSLNYGSSTLIKWSSTGALTCRMYGGSISSSSRNSTGLSTGALSDDTTYTATCSNSTGSSSDSVKVSVFPVVNSFISTKTKVNYNDPNDLATLNWNVSGAKSCKLYSSNGKLAYSYIYTTSPAKGFALTKPQKNSVTYTLTCSTKTTVPPPSSAGYCAGGINGYNTTDTCSGYKTISTCLNGSNAYDSCVWHSL